MKRLKIALAVFLSLILISAIGIYIYNRLSVSPIYIAVMVPDEESVSAQRAITAIQMQIDEMGSVDGHPIQLIIKEDGQDSETAKQVVDEIAQENKALIILGNIYSTPVIAIGEKLQSYGIPAITAGATAPDVTLGNPWFFRVIPDNTIQGGFIAGYANKVLGYQTAIIIYQNNDYGISLCDGFENAFRSFDGQILAKHSISASGDQLDEEVRNILSQVDETPDLIFLATEKTSAAAFVTAMRKAKIDIPLMGGDDLGDQSFTERFPVVKGTPGYYTEGLYAASPLIFDITSDKTQEFNDRYMGILQQPPTWFSATRFDSALVALKAIQEAGISGNSEDIVEDREKVRAQLSR